ncbi:HlyD family type I secretion periplasmic adaptor subunit [Sphingobium sp. H39-3-25]|uniref:HlyD family type I secretion periplasmic adaptor subunit n=1 Tax=Sphingobium arseniciresistens TaxID=3030834 RepID=UPI0023B97B48|nr:HlyD family type I secretion periplasmic adaptor subunit [Sphingobium arseniciresistens]
MTRRWIDWVRRQSGSRQIILFSAGGMLLFLLWAGLATVDEVTHGQGRVIPSSKAQVIQSAEPTTIKEILVRSGQKVRKDQLLVRLDDAILGSELGQLRAETRSLSARAGRLGMEGTGSGTICAATPDGTVAPECRQEQALAQVRESALRSRQAALAAAVEQRSRDLAEAQATIQSLEGSVQLAQRQVDMLEPLAAKSVVPQTDLLSARRELVDTQGRLAAARQQASRAAAAIREAQAQQSEAGFQFRQDALNERSELQAKIAVNSESLRGARGRAERAEIRSPVEGVVNDVQVTTIGGFVSPGQKIMQVVPLGEKLLVEARVRPSDIAFIKAGDHAVVKVTAYDFSIYGGLSGTVQQISADSVYDEATKEAYFTVVVETDRSYLMSGGRRLPITPGMVCDVEVLTGRKTILAYLLKPVLKARSDALRER